jgi:hypothetical protein
MGSERYYKEDHENLLHGSSKATLTSLLVKVCWIQGRDLECEKVKVFESKLFERTTKKRS